MALKPLQDRIVIKVIEDTEQTSGGIFIPDSAKEKPQKGEVVAVGEGKTNDKGESYVDVVFAIDSNGYVICEDYKTTGNQINRFLTKLLG